MDGRARRLGMPKSIDLGDSQAQDAATNAPQQGWLPTKLTKAWTVVTTFVMKSFSGYLKLGELQQAQNVPLIEYHNNPSQQQPSNADRQDHVVVTSGEIQPNVEVRATADAEVQFDSNHRADVKIMRDAEVQVDHQPQGWEISSNSGKLLNMAHTSVVWVFNFGATVVSGAAYITKVAVYSAARLMWTLAKISWTVIKFTIEYGDMLSILSGASNAVRVLEQLPDLLTRSNNALSKIGSASLKLSSTLPRVYSAIKKLMGL